MRKSKKPMVVGVALAFVAVLGIGGTIAWLTDDSGPVTNTFTVGDVEITLTESPLNEDGTYGDPQEGTSNAYQMIPGTTYTKDPKVTVDKKSEACFLFVKFEEVDNPAMYLEYESTLTTANGWTQGDGTNIPANVWWRVVTNADADQSWNLLEHDQITVSAENVTKSNVATASQAKLIYTAYAVQKDNIDTAADAWKVIA